MYDSDTNQPGKSTTKEKEESDRNQVEHGDAFVIAGQQPALEPMLIVEIAQLRQLSLLLIWKRDNGTHWFTVPGTPGAVLPFAGALTAGELDPELEAPACPTGS